MACINADGTLTPTAEAVLAATRAPVTPADIARATGLPLYRIRMSLRELGKAGLLKEIDGGYQATEAGTLRLDEIHPA